VLGRYLDIAAMGATRWTGEGSGTKRDEWPGLNVVVDFGSSRPPR